MSVSNHIHPRLRRRRVLTVLSLVAVLAALLTSPGGPAAAERSESAVRPVAAASIAAGSVHACALAPTGAVRCWGNNSSGRLGYGHTNHIGDDEPASSMGAVQLGAPAAAISAGFAHTCALLVTGDVRCWGSNGGGRLGLGHTRHVGDNEVPTEVPVVELGGKAIAVAAGEEHTCALLTTGRVRCWGTGSEGQLGYGPALTQPLGDDELPTAGNLLVPLGAKATALTTHRDHTCALLVTGRVRCWGGNVNGELGLGNSTTNPAVGDDETPDALPPVSLGDEPVTAVSAGDAHTCAVLATGGVRCWGVNVSGQLGYNNTSQHPVIGDEETPEAFGPVLLGEPVHMVSAGEAHTCALLRSGSVQCWGLNQYGRVGVGIPATFEPGIGDDEPPTQYGPVRLDGDLGVAAVSAGGAHSCAAMVSGDVRCWGKHEFGTLGYGPPFTQPALGDDEFVDTVGPVPVGAEVRTKAPTRTAASATPVRDRRAPYRYRLRGSITPLGVVKDAATCTGSVRLEVRRSTGRLLASRTVPLGRDCRFDGTVTVKASQVGGRPVRLTGVTAYRGSQNLTPSTDRVRLRAN